MFVQDRVQYSFAPDFGQDLVVRLPAIYWKNRSFQYTQLKSCLQSISFGYMCKQKIS